MPLCENMFYLFSSDGHTVIAVIVPLFLFSCYLSYASSSTLCKTFLFSAITSPCHVCVRFPLVTRGNMAGEGQVDFSRTKGWRNKSKKMEANLQDKTQVHHAQKQTQLLQTLQHTTVVHAYDTSA